MDELIGLVNEMSPYILLGFLLAGLMHAFIPRQLYRRYLGQRSFRSVVNAALLGIPLLWPDSPGILFSIIGTVWEIIVVIIVYLRIEQKYKK